MNQFRGIRSARWNARSCTRSLEGFTERGQMVTKKILRSRAEWLEERSKTIGGSEAAAVLGMNPWMSNVELWEVKVEKTEKKEEDNQNVFTIYGTLAESHLRELFKLDYPSQRVFYEENNLFRNDRYPWAHASLDGWLENRDRKRGVLEVKTANVMSGAQMVKWSGKIPDHYFIQVLHEMAVYDADYAYVKAQLKRQKDGEPYHITQHYFIDRRDVNEQIDYLMEAEKAFWEMVKDKVRPGLILPEL